MRDESSCLPQPLSAELDLLLAASTAWIDPSGGLHAGDDLSAAFGDGGGEARYELLDDAGGRFVIDGETGCLALADPALAAAELGCVHPVRVRMRDPFRGDHDAFFHLRIAEPLPMAVLPDGADPLARFEVRATPDIPEARSLDA